MRRIALSVLALPALALGAISLVQLITLLTPPAAYHKDFLAIYLLAAAALHHDNVLTTYDVLGARYLPDAQIYPQALAHPPTMGVLFAPLAALDYPTAAALWLAASLAMLAVALTLIALIAGIRITPVRLLAFVLIALAWYPVRDDLASGQVTILTLLLLVLVHRAISAKRPYLAGTFLAVSLLIKPLLAVLLVVLLVRRQWRTLGACAATVATGIIPAVVVFGTEWLYRYPTWALPSVAKMYGNSAFNSTISVLASRIFSGTHSLVPLHSAITAGPVIDMPSLAAPVGIIASLLVIAWILRLSARLPLPDALAVMTCVCIVTGPMGWNYYRVALLLPAAILFQGLRASHFPRPATSAAIMLVVLNLPSSWQWGQIAGLLVGVPVHLDQMTVLPAGIALLSFVPSVAILALAPLTARTSTRFKSPEVTPPSPQTTVVAWRAIEGGAT